MALQHAKQPLYGNCIVRSPAGHNIFRCADKKMRWYLERGLAKKIQDDPPRIQLLFQPNGAGHLGDPFFLQARKNECVVCGTDEELTLHHILPHSYRRWFPRELDRYGTYDVVALCTEHHEYYEKVAWQLRQTLAKEYDAALNGTGGRACPEINRAVNAAFALIRYRAQMPDHRIAELEKEVASFFGGQKLSEAQLRDLVHKNRRVGKTHGQMVVEQLSDYEELGAFTVRWRKHFVKIMEPKFLPKHWEVERVFIPE